MNNDGLHGSRLKVSLPLKNGEHVSLSVTAALILIGIVLTVSMVTEHLLLGVAILAVPALLILISGSPLRILLMVLFIQFIFTVDELTAIQIWLFRLDELLLVLFLFLWALSLPDGCMKGLKYGFNGYMIPLYLALCLIAFYRGYASGVDTYILINQSMSFGGYFFYFPFLWLLKDPENRKWLWRGAIAVTFVGSAVYTLRGYFMIGDEVYIREGTGIRVATRQTIAYATVIMVFAAKLWKNWRHRPSMLFIIPMFLLSGSAIILSQTRSIWLGVLLGFAGAWILNLFRKKDSVNLGRKIVVSLTTLAVIVVLLVFSVSVMGIISASEMARRTSSETGNYLTDTSALARLLAWNSILQDLQGATMISGKGFGAVYTSFRPDYRAAITVHYVDSVYFQLALNMGIIGVLAFLAVFVSAGVTAAKTFLATDSDLRAGLMLGAFAAIIMLLFSANFAANLTNYRFTVLWALLLALIQSEYTRECKGG